MKKTFLIIAFVLVLSACGNQASPPTNQPPVQQPSGADFGGGGPNQNLPKPTTSGPETKMYTNSAYNYSISYPGDWFVDAVNANSPIVKRGGSDSIGGDLLVSNYQNPSKYNMDNPEPQDMQLMTMMVYPKNDAKNLIDFMRKIHLFHCDYNSLVSYQACDEYKGNKVTNTTINKLNTVTFEMHAGNALTGGVLIEKDGKVFYFNYNKPAGLSAEDDILLKVASSFKGQ